MKYLNTKPGSLEEVAANLSKYATESEYQDMFKKELEKAGKNIGAMTGAEKKAFFNKIDTKYKAKNEAVKEPYAVGMAAAMKQTGDTPPLKKSTITKAHDIAKSIEKDEKKEEVKEQDSVSMKKVDKFHTDLDKLVHKSFGHSSDEKGMKKETHSFVTNKMNQKQKDVDGEKKVITKEGEKDIVDPKPKMSFKEAYKKVKEAMNTIGDANADRANQGPVDNDVKKPKGKTMTGANPTPVDTSPEIEYKN